MTGFDWRLSRVPFRQSKSRCYHRNFHFSFHLQTNLASSTGNAEVSKTRVDGGRLGTSDATDLVSPQETQACERRIRRRLRQPNLRLQLVFESGLGCCWFHLVNLDFVLYRTCSFRVQINTDWSFLQIFVPAWTKIPRIWINRIWKWITLKEHSPYLSNWTWKKWSILIGSVDVFTTLSNVPFLLYLGLQSGAWPHSWS